VIAAAVLLAAWAMVPPASRRAVALGVAAAAGWQALHFTVTARVLGRHRLAAFGVGMLARLLLVAAAAVAVRVLEVPPAPALLSLVTVLFATTLIEPVLHGAGAGNDRDR
jgi:hypothetical protein